LTGCAFGRPRHFQLLAPVLFCYICEPGIKFFKSHFESSDDLAAGVLIEDVGPVD
jgi:hypothetical protein